MANNNKIWVLTFGTANNTDESAANAYCGCIGVFKNKPAAVKMMKKYKEDFITELFTDEDVADAMTYGSTTEGYFEIDYKINDIPHEAYIKLEEIEITE